MAEPYSSPRRFPRVKVLGNVMGEVSLLQDVTLLDLSEGGARLENAGRFALNAICFLRLPGPEGELLLKVRGVHSAVSRTIAGPAGGPIRGTARHCGRGQPFGTGVVRECQVQPRSR